MIGATDHTSVEKSGLMRVRRRRCRRRRGQGLRRRFGVIPPAATGGDEELGRIGQALAGDARIAETGVGIGVLGDDQLQRCRRVRTLRVACFAEPPYVIATGYPWKAKQRVCGSQGWMSSEVRGTRQQRVATVLPAEKEGVTLVLWRSAGSGIRASNSSSLPGKPRRFRPGIQNDCG